MLQKENFGRKKYHWLIYEHGWHVSPDSQGYFVAEGTDAWDELRTRKKSQEPAWDRFEQRCEAEYVKAMLAKAQWV